MIEFEKLNNIPDNFTGYCIILSDLSTRYFKDGLHHREDGPAVEFMSGTKYWYVNGKEHREDGPAIISKYGDQYWYINGGHHREDGPAVVYSNGDKNWCYKNKLYGINNVFTVESWKKKVKEIKYLESFEIFK